MTQNALQGFPSFFYIVAQTEKNIYRAYWSKKNEAQAWGDHLWAPLSAQHCLAAPKAKSTNINTPVTQQVQLYM